MVKRLVCSKMTRELNEGDITRSDIHLTILDDNDRSHTHLGPVFPATFYPQDMEVGDEIEVVIRRAAKK